MDLFYFSTNDLFLDAPEPKTNDHPLSLFDKELRQRWKEANDKGICRYQLNILRNGKMRGKYGFILQLNAERAVLRRKHQEMKGINVPFDPSQFNFNKVHSNEVLLRPRYLMNNDEPPEEGKVSEDDHSLVINASPVEFGSSLLVPSVSKNIRQKVTLEGLNLLINLMLLSNDPGLRGAFNSPGGYSSVNHQHYHLYYLEERLYIETVKVEHIKGPCYALTDFPAKGFAFQLYRGPTQLARDVLTLVTYLRKNEIAHNLYLTRGKRFDDPSSELYDTLRVFVWARESMFGDPGEMDFYASAAEIAGHITIQKNSVFDTLTEEMVGNVMEKATSACFHRVVDAIPGLYSSEE